MAHINIMEADSGAIRGDIDFAETICAIIKSSLGRFRKENSYDTTKRIDYGSVTVVCGYCGERNTLCVEVKADDATMFKKTEKGEKKLANVFEELLITIMEKTEKENRAGILQAYVQRYGALSNEAGETVKKLLEGQ